MTTNKINRFSRATGNEPRPGDLADHLRQEDSRPDRVIASPVPVLDIHTDIRQPRRALPAAVRAGFTGDPTQILDILERWHNLAVRRAGQRIEVPRYLFGTVEADDIDTDDPIVTRYLALLRLAADIHERGLIHFPNVAELDDGYILESGERRLLAHHLLMIHVDTERYGTINVVIKPRASVWAQATENTASEGYSPIEKARQLALLLMDMWQEDRTFQPISDMITPDGSDRPYYAQALELNARRGQGQKLLNAMGVSSRGTVAKYKKLLELSDGYWLWGETKNKTLNDLLGLVDADQGTSYKVDSYVSKRNITDEKTPDLPPEPAESDPYVSPGNITGDQTTSVRRLTSTVNGWSLGDRCYHDRYGDGVIVGIETSSLVNVKFAGGDVLNILARELQMPRQPTDDNPLSKDAPDDAPAAFAVNDRVHVTSDGPGTVTSVLRDGKFRVQLDRDDRVVTRTALYLVPVATPHPASNHTRPQRRDITTGAVIRHTDGSLMKVTERLFNGQTLRTTCEDGSEATITYADIESLADISDWDARLFSDAPPPNPHLDADALDALERRATYARMVGLDALADDYGELHAGRPPLRQYAAVVADSDTLTAAIKADARSAHESLNTLLEALS
jgi:hypothetical protein